MEQMQQDRYIENLHTVRELAKPQIEVGMTAQEVLDRIQQNAARSYQLMQENNRLLQELVFSRRAEELTDADIQELEAFSGRLFVRQQDAGLPDPLPRQLQNVHQPERSEKQPDLSERV